MDLDLQNLVEFLFGCELFAEHGFGLPHPLGRNRHLPPQGFLINQFFEDDHVECALAHLRLHALRNTVVGLAVRKNDLNLAGQISVGQDCAVHARHRPGHGQARRLRGDRRCVRCGSMRGDHLCAA